ncbi:MAG: hypothetical protein GEU78_15030 [Actinobacteria bacterium]|nr:hypothetical protein [Actinomycetota bacterium]
MSIEVGSSRWQELVREGIARDGNRNWFLGDAALEIAPMGEDGAHNGSTEKLEQYANLVGVEAKSLYVYRAVAAAWPPVTRLTGDTSWKVHQLLMTPEKRTLIREGMTVTEAHRAAGHSTQGRTGPEADPEAKREQFRKLADDPDIAPEVDEWATERVVQRHADRRDAQQRPTRGDAKPFRKAMTEMELTLLSKLDALDHFANICRDINENEVDLDPETFGKLTAVAQQIVVEIQFYAIRHGLDCDLKVAQ